MRNERFRKIYEGFSPNDLCWLHVKYYYSDKKVVLIDPKKSARIEICSGQKHQLDELISVLQHVRDSLPLDARSEN